jgi:hypothetical protein
MPPAMPTGGIKSTWRNIMPELDQHKVEDLFNMDHIDNFDDGDEQQAILHIKPFLPDPLLLTPQSVNDILYSYYKETL